MHFCSNTKLQLPLLIDPLSQINITFRYSSIVDEEIKEQMNASEEKGSIMHEFAMMSISSFKYKGTDTGTNLVLALNHANPAVRTHGIDSLIKVLTSGQV